MSIYLRDQNQTTPHMSKGWLYQDDTFYRHYEADLANFYDYTRILRDEQMTKKRGQDMRQVASIPVVMQMKLLNDHGIDIYADGGIQAAMKLIRTDPDYKFMATSDGKSIYL